VSGDHWRLDGKRALVTGASRGIGAAVAASLAERGASVHLAARGGQALKRGARWLGDQFPGARVDFTACDVAQARDRDRLLEAVRAAGGGLDILVNNVGTNLRRPVLEYSAQEYRAIMATNLESCFELSRLCHSLLAAAGDAAVVNIASVAGLTHLRTGAPYAMSKAAMIQLTRNLAVEWARDGIRVNAIAPWYIDTPLARQVLEDDDYRRRVLERTPVGRVGESAEVGDVAAFLCLPAAGYVTGQCLAVDGGFTVYGF